VPKIIAPPAPCRILKSISRVIEVEAEDRREEVAKMSILLMKIFFLPWMSATFPKGKRSIAAAKM